MADYSAKIQMTLEFNLLTKLAFIFLNNMMHHYPVHATGISKYATI